MKGKSTPAMLPHRPYEGPETRKPPAFRWLDVEAIIHEIDAGCEEPIHWPDKHYPAVVHLARQAQEKANLRIHSSFIELETGAGISLHDITPEIRAAIDQSGITNGFVLVTSQHTTTAIAINEHEARLLEDVKHFLLRLIPPGDRYLHNDIALRDCPPDEPENAHSHLAAMLIGSSEAIGLAAGKLVLGQYQSVMLYELDGPRRRRVHVQVYGE